LRDCFHRPILSPPDAREYLGIRIGLAVT
jgi:hypothetical protein